MQLTGYYMAIEGSEHGSRGIQPDIPVEYSIADILAGKDKEMEVALGRLARRAGDVLQQEDRLQRGQITPPSFEVADVNKTSQNP